MTTVGTGTPSPAGSREVGGGGHVVLFATAPLLASGSGTFDEGSAGFNGTGAERAFRHVANVRLELCLNPPSSAAAALHGSH